MYSLSRKWRLSLLSMLFTLVFIQIWLMLSPSFNNKDRIIEISSINETLFANNEKQPVLGHTERPKKQYVLNGFGGFSSHLPTIQHSFNPEPTAYTKIREKRRLTIKKSFLHGWNGYSKYTNSKYVGTQ